VVSCVDGGKDDNNVIALRGDDCECLGGENVLCVHIL